MTPRRRSKDIKYIDLRALSNGRINTYGLVLAYLQKKWPDTPLENDLALQPDTVPLVASRCAVGHTFMYKDSIRYGSSLDNRSTKDRFGLVDFADTQVPCKLLYHFEIHIGGKSPVFCSVIQRMLADDAIPSMPWDL